MKLNDLPKNAIIQVMRQNSRWKRKKTPQTSYENSKWSDTKMYHMAHTPLELNKNTEVQTNDHYKPRGLWLAPGRTWYEYVQEREWLSKYAYAYEIQYVKKKVYTVTRFNISSFSRKYVKGDENKNYWLKKPPLVKFKELQDLGYSGIDLCDIIVYIQNLEPRACNEKKKFAKKFAWLYGYDVPSVIIWNPAIITSIKRVQLKTIQPTSNNKSYS